MPDIEFRMWGEPARDAAAEAPGNVHVERAYTHLAGIPLAEADAWLYTSQWGGVPGRLLDLAVTGIPIVGSLVGGTGEVLGADDAWPVAESGAPEAYVQAIRTVLTDPAGARRRAVALRERLLRERDPEGFATRAADVLLAPRDPEGGRR
jgi:glycosyltransferase involved in cell wall biosynthesis